MHVEIGGLQDAQMGLAGLRQSGIGVERDEGACRAAAGEKRAAGDNGAGVRGGHAEAPPWR